MKTLVVLISFLLLWTDASPCNSRDVGNGPFCVCNVESCDTVPTLEEIQGDFKIYYTSSTEPGFNTKSVNYDEAADAALIISVGNDKLQTIIGFGGAFTDAASINLQSVSDEMRALILQNYFGDNGIEYNMCRVPLGACDFSPRPYTLDDTEGNEEDLGLLQFSLQEEDLSFKIPTMLEAINIRGDKPLNLFASAWTAPLWMKNKQIWHGGSSLRQEYYQVWADYHMKFFDEYLERGVKFWGLTVGNEPLTGFMVGTTIPSMGWDTMAQMDYIVNNLGPTLRQSQHSDLKMMIIDDSLNVLTYMVGPMLNNTNVLQYVDGVALHWYQDGALDPDLRNLAKTDLKDVFILETETCHFITNPVLGSWERAVNYIDDIITDLQYGYAGWIEWNLALNMSGGPTHINVPADSPIIISDDHQEFYKQPMFYAIGHFSKFVVPDSVRLNVTPDNYIIRAVAFLRPDGLKVVNIYNYNVESVVIQLEDDGKYSAPIELSPQSITTVIY